MDVLFGHLTDILTLDEQNFVVFLQAGALGGEARGDLPQEHSTITLLAQHRTDGPVGRTAGEAQTGQHQRGPSCDSPH